MNGLNKVIVIMVALFVAQVILWFALPKEGARASVRDPADAEVAGRAPFASIEAKDVRSVTISGGDGKVVELTAQKKDGTDTLDWTIANRDGYPARPGNVERLVESAGKLRLSRVITREPKRYSRLNVADGVMHARVQIAGEGGRKLADFRIGDSKDFNAVYVRMEGDPAVYEATGVSTWEFSTGLSSYVDSSCLELKADEITRVKLVSDTGFFEVVKETPPEPDSRPETQADAESRPESQPAQKPKPRWVVAGNPLEKLDQTKVDSWVRSMARLSLSEPVGREKKPEHGFDKALATVTLILADGTQTIVTIGAQRPEEKDYYASATGKDFVVTVPQWVVTDSFQKKLSDLEGTGDPAPETGDDDHDHDHADHDHK